MTEAVERRRAKSAIAWGVVGALAFLVAHQAYLLLDGAFLGVGPVAIVAVLVFAVTTVVAYMVEGRLAVQRSEERVESE